MRAFGVFLIALGALAMTFGGYRYGLVTHMAARQTAADWRADPAEPNERGYCVAGPMSWGVVELDHVTHDTAFYVWRATPAKALAAGPDSLIINCGPGVPTIHTHPCEAGASGVCDCNPSREDYVELEHTGAPFAVVQCGERQFVFYFPVRK